MEAEGVDAWYMRVGGNVNLRVFQNRFRKMKGRLQGDRKCGEAGEAC